MFEGKCKLQVSVGRRLGFGLVADRFRSFSRRSFLPLAGSNLRHPSGSSLWSLLPGLFLIGCLTLLSGCGSIAGGPAQVTSKATTVQLSDLSCTNTSMTGAGTDSCTVTLNAAAGSSGLSVNLSSSSTAVTVPASVTVPAGAASASFSAAISAVASAQTATLTAGSNGANVSTALQLIPESTGAVLTTNATSLAFGDVALNTAATQTLTLSSTGTTAVIVNAATLAGTGFSDSGVTLPATLNPGQTISLAVQFDPATAGAATGLLTLTSNSSTGGSTVISLSGTGTATVYQVDLTWGAPGSSSDPVAGYNVYRSTGGNSSYQLLNASVVHTTTYNDSSVQNGITYSYYVESVDAAGIQSGPSNIYTASIP